MKDTTTGKDARSGQAVQAAGDDLSPVSPRVAAGAPNGSPAGLARCGGQGTRLCPVNATEGSPVCRAQSVSQAVEIMNLIVERINATSGLFARLGENSDQIGALVGTIEEIADQTSVLAISAAIETTRTAAPGPGFALIADRVRALAEQTGRATSKIGEAIRAMQGATRLAAPTTADDDQGEPCYGAKGEGRYGNALQEALGQIVALSRQVSQIATVAGEQTATVRAVAKATGEDRHPAKEGPPPASKAPEVATGSKELDILIARVQRQ